MTPVVDIRESQREQTVREGFDDNTPIKPAKNTKKHRCSAEVQTNERRRRKREDVKCSRASAVKC